MLAKLSTKDLLIAFFVLIVLFISTIFLVPMGIFYIVSFPKESTLALLIYIVLVVFIYFSNVFGPTIKGSPLDKFQKNLILTRIFSLTFLILGGLMFISAMYRTTPNGGIELFSSQLTRHGLNAGIFSAPIFMLLLSKFFYK